jgi:uncharacterized protein YukE
MATPLEEFVVALTFKTDEGGASRFRSSTQKSSVEVELLQKRVKELELALKRVSESFAKTAADPARKFAEFGQKIAQTTRSVITEVGNIGRSAAALGGAFTGAMDLIARGADQTRRISTHARTTVADLKMMQDAAERAGVDSNRITNALVGMNKRISEMPGMAGVVKDMFNIDWPNLKNKFSEGMLPILRDLDKMSRDSQGKLQPALMAYANQVADYLHLSREALDEYRAAPEVFEKAWKEAEGYAQRVGKGQRDITEGARRWREQMAGLAKNVKTVGDNAFATAEPAFSKLFETINKGLEKVVASEAENPGIGLVSAGALAVSGLQSIIPALRAMGVQISVLNPWVLGLAAAAGLIMMHWDELGPYFDRKFKEIKKAYDEGGLEAAIEQTMVVAKDMFKDAVLWLTPRISDMAKRLREYPWADVGDKIGKFLVDGIIAMFGGTTAKDSVAAAVLEAFKDIEITAMQIGGKIMWGIARGMITRTIPGSEAAVEKAEEIVEKAAESSFGKRVWENLKYGPFSAWKALRFGFGGGGGDGEQPPEGGGEQSPELGGGLRAGGALSFQRGGVVSADLHQGEMVLPANISRGLQRMIRASESTSFQTGPGARADEKLERWLSGVGDAPKVQLDFEALRAIFQAMAYYGGEAMGAAGGAVSGGIAGAYRAMMGGGGGGPGVMGGPGPGVMGAAGGPQPGAGTRGDPRGMIPVIEAAAMAHGIDPKVAVRVARSEGLAQFYGDQGRSGGAFQLFTGGGLGNEFRQQTGKDPLDPKNEVETIWFAMQKAAEKGWGAWYGAAKVGVSKWEGIGVTQPSEAVAQTFPGGVVGESSRLKQTQAKGARDKRAGLQQKLVQQLDAAAQRAGVTYEVSSGARLGSYRHGGGGAADVKLRDASGKLLDMRNPADQAIMGMFMEEAVAQGAEGVGAGMGYMGANLMHIGGGRPGTWGAGGRAATTEPWVRRAHTGGMARRGFGGPTGLTGGLSRMQDAQIGGQLVPGGALTTNNNGNNVDMNVVHNVNIYGGTGESDTVGRFVGASRRVIQDLQRDMSGAMA